MPPRDEQSSSPLSLPVFALAFISISLLVFILNVAAEILIPLVIALFVWYLINAIARGISRVSIGSFTPTRLLSFFLAILLLLGGLWLTYELISANAAEVMKAAPEYQKKFASMLPDFLSLIPEEFRPNSGEIANYINVGTFITALVKAFSGIAGKTVIVLLYTGFLLYEQQFFSRKLEEMFTTRESQKRVHKVLGNIDLKIQRYIWVKTLISAVAGLATWGALAGFHIDFAGFWGVMTFFLNFIPYVGSFVAIMLPVIIAVVQFGDVTTIMLVLISLSAIHLLLGHLLDPYLMGSNLNLSPIIIITGLAMWGMIWGVPGMFLAIPILAILAIILGQFEKTRPIAILMSKTGIIDKKS